MLVFLFVPKNTFAETIITPATFGANIGNTTWTKAGSPYIVDGIVSTRLGSLTIDPGVVVKFTPNSILSLHADVRTNFQGQPNDPIYFTSLKDDSVGGDTNGDGVVTVPAPGDWGYATFGGGSRNNNMNIQYLSVRYGGGVSINNPFRIDTIAPALYILYPGFSGQQGQSYTLETVEVSHSAGVGLAVFSGFNNSVSISNSSFHNNQTHGVYKTISSVTFKGHDQSGGLSIDENWWGDVSGPYHGVLNPTGIGDAIGVGAEGGGAQNPRLPGLSSWLLENPLPGPSLTPDPVIIIPGILGSWEKNGELVIDPVLHTYDDLINTFVLNGFELGKTIFPFPYEWRESNILTAGLLRNKINEVQAICECDKVDIVAHSMGGLVARYYIQSGLYENDVDQLVFLGTPHLGSVDSYLIWEGADFAPDSLNFVKKFFFSVEARREGFTDLFDYIRNRPIISIQQLLPTFNYLRDQGIGLRPYPVGYPTNTFLENLNSNVADFLNSGVDVANIIGNTGSTSTISALRVVDSPELPKWPHGYPEFFSNPLTDRGIEYGSGDEIVSLSSAGFINSNPIELDANHGAIVKASQTFVYETLVGEAPTQVSDLQQSNNSLLLLQVLSPVDVQIVSPDGKRIGKNFETKEEINEIPGAFYSGFETDNEYVTIPSPLGGGYRIVSEGTDNGGEYTIVAGYISEGSLVQSEVSSYILPGTSEEIIVTVDSNTPENISVEETTVVSLEALLEHIEQAHILGWITNPKLKKKLIKLVEKEIKKQEKHNIKKDRDDDDDDEGVEYDHSEDNDVEDEKNKKRGFVKKFLKELKKGHRKGQINDEGFGLLKEDINNLEQ